MTDENRIRPLEREVRLIQSIESGDVGLNLLPGWIVDEDGNRRNVTDLESIAQSLQLLEEHTKSLFGAYADRMPNKPSAPKRMFAYSGWLLEFSRGAVPEAFRDLGEKERSKVLDACRFGEAVETIRTDWRFACSDQGGSESRLMFTRKALAHALALLVNLPPDLTTAASRSRRGSEARHQRWHTRIVWAVIRDYLRGDPDRPAKDIWESLPEKGKERQEDYLEQNCYVYRNGDMAVVKDRTRNKRQALEYDTFSRHVGRVKRDYYTEDRA